jgi:hypothetical protein
MSYEMLESPIELTDAELDVVAAGAAQQTSGPKGLIVINDVNVVVGIGDNRNQQTD